MACCSPAASPRRRCPVAGIVRELQSVTAMSTGGPDLFVICKNCQAEVSPYITECPYCGNRLRKRAPKLEKARRQAERRTRQARPSLGRLRKGEIPGIRVDARPYATIALVVAALGLSTAWRADA